MCTVQARTSAFADLERRKAAKQETQRMREEGAALKEIVDKYRDAAHVLRARIQDGKLTVDEAQKTPAGLAALIIGMDVTMGHHMTNEEPIDPAMIKQRRDWGKALMEAERQVVDGAPVCLVLAVYCMCTVCVLIAGRLLQVPRRSPRKGTGGGWGSGATGSLVPPAPDDGKQEGENVTETATEGEQVPYFCVS